MSRGQNKCMVMVQSKNEEDIIVPPDFFRHTFSEIGVVDKCEVTLHEFKNFNLEDEGAEGGEEEHEEMEEEQAAEEGDSKPEAE